MGYSQADKQRSRERILSEAASQVRDAGLESVSVGKLMRSVELTHGGFYNHFESRSELLAQALERALLEGRKASLAGADPEPPQLRDQGAQLSQPIAPRLARDRLRNRGAGL